MWHRLLGIKNITLFGMFLLIVLAFALAWFTSQLYQQFAIQNEQRSIQELLKLETHERVQALYQKQKDFAYRLQNEKPFVDALQNADNKKLQQWLQQSFNRMQAATGQIHFKSLLFRDVNGEVISGAFEDDLEPYSGCPLVIDQISASKSVDNFKSKSALCSYDQQLMSEVVVSVGVIKPQGFLHLIAYVEDELMDLQSAIDRPMRLYNPSRRVLQQTADWEDARADNDILKPVLYTLYGDDNVPGIIIAAMYDMSAFQQQIAEADFKLLLVATVSTFFVLVLVLLLLNIAFKPVDKIRNSVGALLNGHYAPINEKKLPLELTEFVSAYNEMVLGMEDASQRREDAEKALLNERDFISTTLDSITNAVLVLDAQMSIKLANPTAELMLGDSEENLKDQVFDQLVIMYTNRSATHIANLKKLLKTPYQLINLFYQRDGKTIELEMTASPMVDKEADDVGHVLVFKDVTEDRKLRRKLNYEGRHDKLTGFLNRRAFENKFDAMVSDTDYTSSQHIMVYLNLDQFKIVNETCGNVAGDSLLKQVAELIHQNVRKSDLLARLGGDEFGILLPYADAQAAANTVHDIITYILQRGFNWNDKEFTITASAALIPFGLASDDFSDKFSKLASACYLAKQNGGNQYYLIGDDDEKVQEHHSTMGWAAGINKGFSEHRFKLYAQPIVPLSQQEERQHYEILIRYQGEDDTIIRPGEFLAPAEQFNLIEKIDRWVVTEIVHWQVKHQEFKGKVQFSINLSGRSVGSPSFHLFLEQMLKTDLVDPSCLCFEITETAAIKDVEQSIDFIKVIKGLGAKFSLDDFGSGLSSFTYLKQFPVDYLKIDGVFIRDILYDAQSYDFVRSITEVGHCLGMKVIAEFVESKHMYHMLREARVDYLQGYTIGEPEPIESLDLQLQKQAVD